jgi:hypothetical protein
MVNAALRRLAQRHGHVQRPDDQIPLHAVTDRPPITRQWFAFANLEGAMAQLIFLTTFLAASLSSRSPDRQDEPEIRPYSNSQIYPKC